MILGYFILAHLLGDFVFQPTKLVLWKMKSIWGTIVHVLIHLVVNVIIFLPFLINGYFWLIYIILGICFIHFWVDIAKINYDLKHDKKVAPFIVDQLLHLLTIIIAYSFIKDVVFELPDTTFYRIFTNINIVVFVSFLVIVSKVIEVYNIQRKREKNKNTSLHLNTPAMMNRVIVFTLIYSFFMFLTFYVSR